MQSEETSVFCARGSSVSTLLLHIRSVSMRKERARRMRTYMYTATASARVRVGCAGLQKNRKCFDKLVNSDLVCSDP